MRREENNFVPPSRKHTMNHKAFVGITLTLLILCTVTLLYSLCPAGRHLCTTCHCLPLSMFMGILSLGLALVVMLTGRSKKKNKRNR